MAGSGVVVAGYTIGACGGEWPEPLTDKLGQKVCKKKNNREKISETDHHCPANEDEDG